MAIAIPPGGARLSNGHGTAGSCPQALADRAVFNSIRSMAVLIGQNGLIQINFRSLMFMPLGCGRS